VYRNVLSPSDLEIIKGSDEKVIKQMITDDPRFKGLMDPGYEFQDYIFVIKKSSIHTCHRDANGDMFNEGQIHPSYTMLLYVEGGSLNVVPGSQDGRAFNFDGTDQVFFNPGDVIVFDANMVHAGSIGPDNLRIQMKITHHDDRDTLDYYEQYTKIASRDNKLSEPLKMIHQRLSCAVPGISDLTQEQVKRGTNSKLFSRFFYGDENFYELESK